MNGSPNMTFSPDRDSCQDSVTDHCSWKPGQNPGAIFQSGNSQIILKTQRCFCAILARLPPAIEPIQLSEGNNSLLRAGRPKGIEFSTSVWSQSYKRSGDEDLHPGTAWGWDSYTRPASIYYPSHLDKVRDGTLHICKQSGLWRWSVWDTPTIIGLL